VYLNTVLVNACGDYKRPVDVTDEPYFRLRWWQALGEKELHDLDSGFSGLEHILALFDGLCDDSYIFRSGASVSDYAGNEIHYYALTPKAYTKTIVLLGGPVAIRDNAREFAAILYKLAILLRDHADAHPALRDLRDNCRVVMIPTISVDTTANIHNRLEYSSNMSADWSASTSACIGNLRAFIADIGSIDWFVYAVNRIHADLAGDPVEHFACSAAQSAGALRYADHLSRTGRMAYDVTELSGGLGGYLAAQEIPSLRIETSLDYADYEAHKMDYPTSDGITQISTGRYVRLNSETARRLSVLVNLMTLA
jgi:hypothetical protein